MIFNPIAQNSKIPKYQQIHDQVINLIKLGKLTNNERLPTINQMIATFEVNKRTIIKAFRILQQKGIIEANERLGYYILNANLNIKARIFLLFDRLTAFKEELYYAFLETLGDDYVVDIYFYHSNYKLFRNLIMDNLGFYDYFVIATFLKENPVSVLQDIPREKLILIDNLVKGLPNGYSAVYQNFGKDLYQALNANHHLLGKYKSLKMILPRTPYTLQERSNAFIDFCKENSFQWEITDDLNSLEINKKDILIVINDRDLPLLLKIIEHKKYKVGKDLGIISYNDFPLKEYVAGGITTLSTDFKKMGLTAAQFIREKMGGVLRENPSSLIIRQSL